MKRLLAALAFVGVLVAQAQASPVGTWTYYFAEYGEAKYPAGFSHYDYVNPDAPKGGTLTLSNPDRRTSFNKFNPISIRGDAPRGVELYTFETLADQSGDEPATMYGLIANQMMVAPDYSAITFRIDPDAHFNNGDPVTADDVKYSFDVQTSPLASPGISQLFVGVKDAVVLDSRTIRFDMKEPSRDAIFQLGTQLWVFSRKWGAGPDGKPRPIDQIVMEPPIATGAYVVGRHIGGNFLELDRDPNYWARDKGVRRGFFNFDHIIYHFFSDNAARFEGFKSGDFDIIKEYDAHRWKTQYTGKNFDNGNIVKQTYPDHEGYYLQGDLYNTRRPLLADPRVREALSLAFDWEWISKRQSYGLLQRFDGLFQNSDFAATGSPSPAELKLLEPYRSILPATVFGPLPSNPRTDTSRYALRDNLKRARQLLSEAGWNLAPDGRLRNAKGEPFDLEYLSDERVWEQEVLPWAHDLARLGIKLTFRTVDSAVYVRKYQDFDFDIILINYSGFLLPSAGTMTDMMSSASAAETGSGNFMGIRNPAVDGILKAMTGAATMEELEAATRALDRIYVCEHYANNSNYRPFHDTAYWDKFGIPAKEPWYFSIDEGFGQMTWPVMTWWDKTAH